MGIRMIITLLLTLPMMARINQCGYGWPGCEYGGFHDCTKMSDHPGSHMCGACGARR